MEQTGLNAGPLGHSLASRHRSQEVQDLCKSRELCESSEEVLSGYHATGGDDFHRVFDGEL